MAFQRIPPRILPHRWLLACLIISTVSGLCNTSLSQSPSSDSVQSLYAEADAAKARGDLEGAIEKLQNILEINPDLAPVYHNLGILFFEQGKLREAAQAFESGLLRDNNMTASLAPLGISYYQMGQLEKARDALQKATAAQSEDANARLYLGQTLFDLGQQEAGIAQLQELLRQSPNDSRALYELGQMHLKAAQGILRKLETTDPDSYLVHLIHAQMMEGMENYEGALAQYKKAAAKEPALPYAHYNIGNVYWQMRKWDDATREFSQELAANPYDCLAFGQLANILVRTHGDATKALTYATKALDLCPNLSQARMDFGLLLAENGDYEKAIEQYKRAVQLSPEDDDVHLLLGRAYEKLGRTNEATAEFATARSLQNKSSEQERSHQEDVGSVH